MLQSYNQLLELVKLGVLTYGPEREILPVSLINPTSIDLTLGPVILRERYPDTTRGPIDLSNRRNGLVDLAARDSVSWVKWSMSHEEDMDYYDLQPGEFVLAHTNEVFNMPNDLSAEYSLKSSLARNGLEHMLAGWIDPGFNNSTLTLELRNTTRHHVLRLRLGMPIGQVKFFRHEEVPAWASYAARGRYNGDAEVSAIKK